MRQLLFTCDDCGAEKRVRYTEIKENIVNYCPGHWRLFGTRHEIKRGAMALLCPKCWQKIEIKTTAAQRSYST